TEAWLLWFFYATFAAQGVLAIAADASGALGSNLQHRLFPSVSIFAVGLVGVALAQWRPHRFARPLQLALTLGIFCIAILSVLKTTNEPLLSNMWTFYRPSEVLALEWSDAHLQDAEIWTDYNERLTATMLMLGYESTNRNSFVAFKLNDIRRDVLVSKITR